MKGLVCVKVHKYLKIFPVIDDAKYRALVESIKARGLLKPIETYKGRIIDGRARYKACLEAKVFPFYHEWNGQGSLMSHIATLNADAKAPCRRLTVCQKAAVAVDAEEMLCHELGNVSDNTTEALAAQLLGTTVAYLQDTKTIKVTNPVFFDFVKKGIITVTGAKGIFEYYDSAQQSELAKLPHPELQLLAKRAQVRLSAANSKSTPLSANETETAQISNPKRYRRTSFETVESGTFGVVYCDPKAGAGLNSLFKVDLDEWIAPSAVLFVWSEISDLPLSLELMTNWGFEYRSLISWDKGMFFDHDKWPKHQNELLLIGERGKCIPTPSDTTTQIFTNLADLPNPNARPEVFLKTIEAMFPNQPVLSIFGMAPRRNWVTKRGGFC